MSEVADLLRAIASLLWVVIGIAVVILFAKVLIARSGQLKTFGVGPTGLTMEAPSRPRSIRPSMQTYDLLGHACRPGSRTVGCRSPTAECGPSGRRSKTSFLGADDHPENNTPIIELLRRFGAVVETPRFTKEALGPPAGARYDVVISDVSRDDEGPNSEMMGVELAAEVFARWSQQILLFTARFNPATLPGASEADRLELVRELERTVFGRTNRMDIALHLIMDILER